MGAVCLHLYHGVYSMTQTLGANSVRADQRLRVLSRVFAVVIFVGFMSVPVAVMAGFRG
jgi:succinate dehydrogenase / fumarate reductase cytochrome b subunit